MPRRENVTCHQCQRGFTRFDHLQRHLLTHSSVSAHECLRCRRAFKRKDALTRHLTTCTRKPSLSTATNDQPRYRYINSNRQCDSKASCYGLRIESGNTDQCSVRASDDQSFSINYSPATTSSLSYLERMSTDTSLEDSNQPEDECIVPTNGHSTSIVLQGGALDHEVAPAHPELTRDMTIQSYSPSPPPATCFLFLIRFTEKYSLTGCFSALQDIDTVLSDQCRLSGFPAETLDDLTNVTLVTSTNCGRHLLSQSYSQPQALSCDDIDPILVDYLSTSLDTPGWTTGKSWNICSAIRKCSSDWSISQEWRCLTFFSPHRIVLALDLYWSMWHPNWPVIHKPSFDVDRTPPPLLAAMVVIGSCHDNLNDARYWFDAVENLAFNELQFESNLQHQYRRIQSIQAAYLACIYQTWDGGELDRTRIRHHRFKDIVKAMRELDLPSFRHDIFTEYKHFDWMTFVRQEESIRTLLWVYQLDTAFIIFNNLPPHFALRELSMGLASCEASFQASSPRECFGCLRDWLAHNPRPAHLTLYGLIKLFFKKQLSASILDHLAHESFMNLWCVVAAFHVILFNLDPVLGGEEQLDTLRIGIDTWESIWKRRLRNNDERFFDPVITTASLTSSSGVEASTEPWKRPGFWKNAAEYWLLARLILERMMAAHEGAMAADELSGTTGLHLNIGPHVYYRGECNDMRNLRSFLLLVGTDVC